MTDLAGICPRKDGWTGRPVLVPRSPLGMTFFAFTLLPALAATGLGHLVLVRTIVRLCWVISGRTSTCVIGSGCAEGGPEDPALSSPTTPERLRPNTRQHWVDVTQEHRPCPSTLGRASICGSSTLTKPSSSLTRSPCPSCDPGAQFRCCVFFAAPVLGLVVPRRVRSRHERT